MLLTDARFAAAVEEAVGQVEARTAAEVVVVAAPRSDRYREVPLLVGAVAAWAALCFVLFSPFHFAGVWLPLELPVVGVLAGWLGGRSAALTRLLTSRRRRAAAVERAAHAAFHEETVHGTRRRTGVLVYVSAIEDAVVVLPDGGVEAHVPGAELAAIRWGEGADRSAPGTLEAFLAGLAALGVVLAAHLPPVEGDDDNQISDAPRVRS